MNDNGTKFLIIGLILGIILGYAAGYHVGSKPAADELRINIGGGR